ncbi:MAG: tryptophan-rich sensory protein, partial [Bacilli bacterium]|nr:tryptophan-rich sensory protein [Bacilli bacterium]
ILYILIGLSYYLYRKNNKNSFVVILYYGQLFFNFTWSLLFFLLKWRMLSIVWIIILILLVGHLMYCYYFQEKKSFYLLVPYFLWLCFALYLNFGIYLLN